MADEATRLFKAFDNEAAQALLQDNLSKGKTNDQNDKKKKDPEKKCAVCQNQILVKDALDVVTSVIAGGSVRLIIGRNTKRNVIQLHQNEKNIVF